MKETRPDYIGISPAIRQYNFLIESRASKNQIRCRDSRKPKKKKKKMQKSPESEMLREKEPEGPNRGFS